MKMRNGILLGIVGSLVLAACGQSSVPQTSSSTIEDFPILEQKTVSQILAEPGWKEVSEGAWFRSINHVDEWIYLGKGGASYEASQIKSELSKISAQKLDDYQEKRRILLASRLEKLEKYISQEVSGKTSNSNLNVQSTATQCTASGSLLRTTAQPGVKAYGTGKCTNPNYLISGFADSHTDQSRGPLDDKVGSNTVSFSSYAYGTSGCYAQIQIVFSDPNNTADRRVALNKSTFSCL